jgi:hypothetical protein
MTTAPRAQVAASLGVSARMLRRRGIGALSESDVERLLSNPPAWLETVRRRRSRRANRLRMRATCCVCGATREVRRRLVARYTHLVCGPCDKRGSEPIVVVRDGMVLETTFNVAGYFVGYTHRIATLEERAALDRAAALARWAQESHHR